MKNLTDICNESILGDINVSIQKTDNIFKQAEVELNAIKNLTWEAILDTAKFKNQVIEFSFRITCPNVLIMLGINNPEADGLIINIELYDSFSTYGVMTVKGKNQRNYGVSQIVGKWAIISPRYIGAIRPKKLSVAIKRIQEALNKIADIDTLKDICSEFKKD